MKGKEQLIVAEIIAKLIPIFLLISIGKYIGYKEYLQQSTIDEIKKIVINVCLSAVLFIAFLTMELKIEYFAVFIIVFILLNILFLIGFGINRIPKLKHPLTPFITSGFTFGLLGIPLFTTVFGIENIGKLSIIGVGHEFFIWLIFYTTMRMRLKQERFSGKVIKEIIRSPLILSIVFGIIFNVAGLGMLINQNPILQGIYVTIEYLANIATPLILIIVGYGLKFNKKYMKQSTRFVMLRMAVAIIIGYAFKYLIINRVMEPDLIFDYAYFTFITLPPPLSLSIFVGAYGTKELEELTNNTVVLNTVVSIAIFSLFILTR